MSSTAVVSPPAPQLNGTHFKITVVVDDRGFVNYNETHDIFDGYFIDVLHTLAKPEKGNFTFDLLTPSGYGSLCNDDDDDDDDDDEDKDKQQQQEQQLLGPYSRKYYEHYPCGESDVTDLPITNYTTDMYLGLFYVTTQRQLSNQFTLPINPPVTGTLTMVGTAVRIDNIHDFVVKQQKQQQLQDFGGGPNHHHQKNKKMLPACVVENTAYQIFLERTYPSIEFVEVSGSFKSWNTALEDKLCDVIIVDHPLAASFVLFRHEQNSCTSHGKVSDSFSRYEYCVCVMSKSKIQTFT